MKAASLLIFIFAISFTFASCGATRGSDCGLSDTSSKQIKTLKKASISEADVNKTKLKTIS